MKMSKKDSVKKLLNYRSNHQRLLNNGIIDILVLIKNYRR